LLDPAHLFICGIEDASNSSISSPLPLNGAVPGICGSAITI
jgi:hypothetical protein